MRILPEWDTFVSLFVFQLLFQRESHGLSTHIEHAINISAVVLQTDEGARVSDSISTKKGDVDILPETIIGPGLPEAFDLNGITGFEEFIVNDLQSRSRKIFWERREFCNGHFVELTLVETYANASLLLYSSSH